MTTILTRLRCSLLCVLFMVCAAAQAENDGILTSDAAFCRSLRASQEAYTARLRAERQGLIRMGDIPLAALAEIPADDDVSAADDGTKELLALPAYESGNIPCLEYLLRKGFALTDRGGQRLAEEIDERGRRTEPRFFNELELHYF